MTILTNRDFMTIIFFISLPAIAEITFSLARAFQFDENGGVFFKVISVLGEFQSLMGDSISFKKVEQMNAIKTSPITYYPIAVCAFSTSLLILSSVFWI